MTTAYLEGLLRSRKPKIYRRVEKIASENSISVRDAILLCLEGVTTRCKSDRDTRIVLKLNLLAKGGNTQNGGK